MVGSPAAVLESNWDIADHDYSRPPTPAVAMSLTPAEDALITQLTEVLEQVPSIEANQVRDGSSPQSQDLQTPDVLKELLDFGFFEKMDVKPDAEIQKNGTKVTVHPNNTLQIVKQEERASSPISKEQILDFLMDKTRTPSPGSESGYESVMSPSSIGSPEASYMNASIGSPDASFMDASIGSPEAKYDSNSNMELDMESFNELFPSLF